MQQFEQQLISNLQQIQPPDQNAMQLCRRRWDSIAKPLHSLGLLEDAIATIASAQGCPQVRLDKKCVAVFCADNGVVAQGVTQSQQDVTAIVTENFCSGQTSVCAMARAAGAEVFPVDIGVEMDLGPLGECFPLLDRKIRRGTRNFLKEPALTSGKGLRIHKIANGTADITQGPAMSREQAADAILYGMQMVGELKQQGYNLIATGEMGIGNTTTSSAILSVLLHRPITEMTGRGAGLSSAGLQRKIDAIARAIEVNRPDANDPLDVLHKVGGFDIAGLVGVFLGGAQHHVPIVIDGVISAAAAFTAMKFCPTAAGYWIAAHVSKEPAGKIVLDALGKKPMLTCEMCLGEGTGAVAAFPVLEMANAVYTQMSTFSEIEIEDYQPLS